MTLQGPLAKTLDPGGPPRWVLGLRNIINKILPWHTDFPLMLNIFLFSFLNENEFERPYILNSYSMALWREDALQDTSVEWDSIIPGEDLARRLSAKFSAAHQLWCFLTHPSPHSRKMLFIFCKSQVWTYHRLKILACPSSTSYLLFCEQTGGMSSPFYSQGSLCSLGKAFVKELLLVSVKYLWA